MSKCASSKDDLDQDGNCPNGWHAEANIANQRKDSNNVDKELLTVASSNIS